MNKITTSFIEILERLKKDFFFENFKPTSTTKKASQGLKNVFFAASILLHFDFKSKIKIETNALKFKVFNIINHLIEFTKKLLFKHSDRA